jgi:hypothetical protein
MRIPFTHGPGTVGREDRLVRGCIALSLLLLAGFAVAMSGQSSLISIAFLVLGLYFTVTAALGRDPFYAHFDIDTRAGAHWDTEMTESDAWEPGPTEVVDLRSPWLASADDRTENSRLGG